MVAVVQHFLFSIRSAARLATGDINGALEDAKEALSLAPHYAEASKNLKNILESGYSIFKLQLIVFVIIVHIFVTLPFMAELGECLVPGFSPEWPCYPPLSHAYLLRNASHS